MIWYVFDPDPTDVFGPVLYGEFPTEDAAREYANLLYPDDGDGNAVVVSLTEPS